MTYSVRRTNGQALVDVAPGTIDVSRSVTLIGKNYAGYGALIAENFVHQLENYANSSPPNNPLRGQLYYDTTEGTLKVFTGDDDVTQFLRMNVTKLTSNTPTTEITDAKERELFYHSPTDTTNDEVARLKYYNGSNYFDVSPMSNFGMRMDIVKVRKVDASGNYYVNGVVDASSTGNNADTTSILVYSKEMDSNALGGNATKALKVIAIFSTESNDVRFGPYATGVGNSDTSEYPETIGNTTETVLSRLFSTDATYIGGTNQFGLFAGNTTSGVAAFASGLADVTANQITHRAVSPGLNNSGLIASIASAPTADNATQLNNQPASYYLSYSNMNNSDQAGALATSFFVDFATNVPTVDNSFDLGSSSAKFANVYATTFNGNLVGDVTGNVTGTVTGTVNTTQASSFQDVSCDDLTVAGNLTVQGTTTTLNVNELEVEDTLITIANGVANASAANGAGLEIDLGTNGSSTMTYDSGNDRMVFNKDVQATVFHGEATAARYADLAEIYTADKVYSAGTVVKLGGDAEITETTTQGDKDVFGVISTQPAFLMNAEADGLPVVMSGKAPVKVEGAVAKGERLISSGRAGYAQGIGTRTYDCREVIGRALEAHDGSAPGTIMAVLGNK